VRYPRELRDNLTWLRELPIITEMGGDRAAADGGSSGDRGRSADAS
jgi:hypothetical protein